MARSRKCFTGSPVPSGRRCGRRPQRVRRARVLPRRHGRRRTDRAREPGRPAEGVHADDVADDSESRQFRRAVRWRRPPWPLHTWGRGASCTRSHRYEHVFPVGASAGNRVCDAVGRSSRETVAALETTCFQHGAAGASGHASAKAMLHRPALLVRLVRTLHERLLGPPRQRAVADMRHGADVSAQATGDSRPRATLRSHFPSSGRPAPGTRRIAPLFSRYPQPARVTRP